jgi:hypothetical protein
VRESEVALAAVQRLWGFANTVVHFEIAYKPEHKLTTADMLLASQEVA